MKGVNNKACKQQILIHIQYIKSTQNITELRKRLQFKEIKDYGCNKKNMYMFTILTQKFKISG